ncbi:MAG: hypothetical protein WBG95_05230 [Sulfitobacter sp.]
MKVDDALSSDVASLAAEIEPQPPAALAPANLVQAPIADQSPKNVVAADVKNALAPKPAATAAPAAVPGPSETPAETEALAPAIAAVAQDVPPAIAAAGKAIAASKAMVADPAARPVLSNLIDGQSAETRSDGQAEAISNALNKVEDTDKLDINLVAVKQGLETLVGVPTGEQVAVTLAEGEKSRLVETDSGAAVLVLADNLTEQQAIREGAGVAADIIAESVEAEGGFVSSTFRESFVGTVIEEIAAVHIELASDEAATDKLLEEI